MARAKVTYYQTFRCWKSIWSLFSTNFYAQSDHTFQFSQDSSSLCLFNWDLIITINLKIILDDKLYANSFKDHVFLLYFFNTSWICLLFSASVLLTLSSFTRTIAEISYLVLLLFFLANLPYKVLRESFKNKIVALYSLKPF